MKPLAAAAASVALALLTFLQFPGHTWLQQDSQIYVPTQLGGGAKLSIPDFQKAIELDPGNAEAYLWLGLSLRKENRDAEARQAFAKSLELNPNRVWAKQQLEKTPAK